MEGASHRGGIFFRGWRADPFRHYEYGYLMNIYNANQANYFEAKPLSHFCGLLMAK